MNHAITVGGLLLCLAAIGGVGAILVGFLMLAAAANMPAGDDGTGTKGCITAAVGLAIFVGSLWGLLS